MRQMIAALWARQTKSKTEDNRWYNFAYLMQWGVSVLLSVDNVPSGMGWYMTRAAGGFQKNLNHIVIAAACSAVNWLARQRTGKF